MEFAEAKKDFGAWLIAAIAEVEKKAPEMVGLSSGRYQKAGR